MQELPGTLARLAHSQYRRQAEIAVSTKAVANVLLKTNKNAGAKVPDSEAVRFYALNQMVGVIQQKFTLNEKLPEWAAEVVGLYERELCNQHKRMFWYLYLITIREFRHLKNKETHLKDPKFSKEFKAFHPHIQDSADESGLNGWLSYVPDEPLTQFFDCLETQFRLSKVKSPQGYGGGYGGPPWGLVTKAVLDYVSGKTCAEVFIDTGYTLAHNNGPVFNKGMFYEHYTGNFLKMLDVQRSGQVCEGLIDGSLSSWCTVEGASALTQHAKTVQKEVGGIGDYIDWYKVEALGALGKYAQYKAAQDKKYGKKAEKILLNGKPVKVVGEMEVFPGQSVDIIQRLAA